jgi:hypothetical protein
VNTISWPACRFPSGSRALEQSAPSTASANVSSAWGFTQRVHWGLLRNWTHKSWQRDELEIQAGGHGLQAGKLLVLHSGLFFLEHFPVEGLLELEQVPHDSRALDPALTNFQRYSSLMNFAAC